MSGRTRVLMSVIYWAFVVYLFVPLVLMVLMGFKDSKFIGFPIRSWTLDWYTGVFADADFNEDGAVDGVDLGIEILNLLDRCLYQIGGINLAVPDEFRQADCVVLAVLQKRRPAHRLDHGTGSCDLRARLLGKIIEVLPEAAGEFRCLGVVCSLVVPGIARRE